MVRALSNKVKSPPTNKCVGRHKSQESGSQADKWARRQSQGFKSYLLCVYSLHAIKTYFFFFIWYATMLKLESWAITCVAHAGWDEQKSRSLCYLSIGGEAESPTLTHMCTGKESEETSTSRALLGVMLAIGALLCALCATFTSIRTHQNSSHAQHIVLIAYSLNAY